MTNFIALITLLFTFELGLSRKIDFMGITHFMSHLDASFEDIGRKIMLSSMTDPRLIFSFLGRKSNQQKGRIIGEKAINIVKGNSQYQRVIARKVFESTNALNDAQKLRLFQSGLNEPRILNAVLELRQSEEQKAQNIVNIMKQREPQLTNKLLQDRNFVSKLVNEAKRLKLNDKLNGHHHESVYETSK